MFAGNSDAFRFWILSHLKSAQLPWGEVIIMSLRGSTASGVIKSDTEVVHSMTVTLLSEGKAC